VKWAPNNRPYLARSLARLAVAAAIALPTASCSLALSFEQCTSDEDCERLSDGLECSPENVCVDPADNDDGGGDGCTHAACGEEDPNTVCGAAGACVQATSPECTVLDLPQNRDNLILFGSIQPTTGDAASAGIPQENAVRLAIKEFNESGLVGDVRFGLIGCDSAGDVERGVAAATHLTTELGLPAIVGPAFSGIFIEVTTTVTVPDGVMTISGSATSESITGIPDEGLAWRTIASDSFQSVAIADRVRDLRNAAGGTLKVAAFGKDDAYGRGLLFAVGADLEEDLGEDNYFGVVYSDPNTDTNAELATEVADALSNNFDDADVVLLLGTAEVTEVLSSYESILDDNNSDASPTFILSDGGKIDETLALVAADMTLSDRIEGTIASLENGAIFTGFRQRYTGEFGEAPGAFASNAYDAAQLLAYGAYTLLQDGQTIDGAGLSNFMSRTVDGQAVQAGPADLSSGLTTLGAGASIDFEGASGPLTFDLGTGEAPSNVDRYVIDVRAADDIRFMDEGQYQVSADGSGEWVGIEEE
jgi:branched-chain amino acid transport system substrate-binding protein